MSTGPSYRGVVGVAHADSDELFDWVSAAETRPATVYVVHGEQSASRTLATTIADRLDWTTAVPRHAERVRLDVTGDQ